MAVATITLASTNGDSVVVSAPNDEYLADEIILDTDPKGLYATGFTTRTQSGAFEMGGRIVGESVPIRELVLPFWLTPGTRSRFQRLWGTPGNLQKVTCTWDDPDTPSGPRHLILKLAREIEYTTDGGFDADIDAEFHAVVSAIAVNPMYEGVEDIASWVNPTNKYTVDVDADGGTFPLSFGGQTATGIAYNASLTAVRDKLAALSSVGAGHVTVTGAVGHYTISFTVPGTLTGSDDDLWSGLLHLGPKSLDIAYVASTGWFEVWNPTDQKLWLEWALDPADEWQFPDFGFDQERKWNRAVGQDAARMIVTPKLTQLLSVMSDPVMDTYVNADLSNAAGSFNGVEPIYAVPPYTGTEDDPILVPVVCKGPLGAKATLRQRRFWSAESGLEA